MAQRNWLVGFAFTCLGTLHLNWARAQTDQRSSLEEIQITTGFGLSLKGLEAFVSISQEDDFGFNYDLASMSQQSEIREALDLSAEQMAAIGKISDEVLSQIQPLLVASVLTDDGDQAKRVFQEAQSEMHDVLTMTQQAQLEQVSNQLAIEKYGLARLLSAKRMQAKLGLDANEQEALTQSHEKYDLNYQSRVLQLVREANQKLLTHLPRIPNIVFNSDS